MQLSFRHLKINQNIRGVRYFQNLFIMAVFLNVFHFDDEIEFSLKAERHIIMNFRQIGMDNFLHFVQIHK